MAASRSLPLPGLSARAATPGATTLVFLAILAFLACIPDRLLADPDTLWHVAIGRHIAVERSVPWADAYSHTFAGAPWIAKEWLAQVLLAGAAMAAGWAGVALLAAVATAAALALLHGFLARRLPPTVALAVTLVAALFCAPHILARPHVLALPLVVLWTRGLVEAAEAGRPPGWWLVAVMAAWANLHGGFTIGFAVAGLIGLDAVLGAPVAGRRARVARWAAFLAAASAAACATPYGYRSLLVTLTLFGSGEPLPYIAEWQPLPMDALGLPAVGLGGAALAALLVRPRENLARIVLLALLGSMALRHARFLELFALLAPLVVTVPVLRLLRRPAPEPAREGGWASHALGAVMLALVAALALRQNPMPDPANAPEAALRAAEARGLTAGRVYNAYDFGGFLIARGVPTFIDGRSDQIFLGGFTRAVNAAVDADGPAPFRALLADRGVTWALVRAVGSEARHLATDPAWRLVHADPVAAVFARGDAGDIGAPSLPGAVHP